LLFDKEAPENLCKGCMYRENEMRRADFDNPDLPLSEAFARWPELSKVFFEHQMLCVGCPIAPFHTLTDACLEYGLNEDQFRGELDELMGRKYLPW
jgi:hybrid cluster-associated redox disulfide protein